MAVGTEVDVVAEAAEEEVEALQHPTRRLLVVAAGDEYGCFSLSLLRRLTQRHHDTR